MREIQYARDLLVDHFEANNGIRLPLVPVLAKHCDRQFAIHFCHCQSPWDSLPFIVSEVGRFVDGTGKTVRDAELSIRANEFAESFPIALIEPVDVEV